MLKALISIIVLSITSLMSINLYAGSENHPGSMCVKWTPSDPEPYLNASRIYNASSTTWLRLDCPVVHSDFDGFLHNGAIDSSWVTMIDQNYSLNGSCSLVSFTQHPMPSSYSAIWAAPAAFTSGSDARPQYLGTGSQNGEDYYSHYYFSCHVPPSYSGNSSGLVTYNAAQ